MSIHGLELKVTVEIRGVNGFQRYIIIDMMSGLPGSNETGEKRGKQVKGREKSRSIPNFTS